MHTCSDMGVPRQVSYVQENKNIPEDVLSTPRTLRMGMIVRGGRSRSLVGNLSENDDNESRVRS